MMTIGPKGNICLVDKNAKELHFHLGHIMKTTRKMPIYDWKVVMDIYSADIWALIME